MPDQDVEGILACFYDDDDDVFSRAKKKRHEPVILV